MSNNLQVKAYVETIVPKVNNVGATWKEKLGLEDFFSRSSFMDSSGELFGYCVAFVFFIVQHKVKDGDTKYTPSKGMYVSSALSALSAVAKSMASGERTFSYHDIVADYLCTAFEKVEFDSVLYEMFTNRFKESHGAEALDLFENHLLQYLYGGYYLDIYEQEQLLGSPPQ